MSKNKGDLNWMIYNFPDRRLRDETVGEAKKEGITTGELVAEILNDYFAKRGGHNEVKHTRVPNTE